MYVESNGMNLRTESGFNARTGAGSFSLRKVLPSTDYLRRVFWVLMVVAHAPGLIGIWSSLFASDATFERLSGCIGLTFAMVLFVLKVLDAPFLRFRTSRHSVVVLCMIVALLHVDVIRRGSDPGAMPESVALVATTWLAAIFPRTRRRLSVIMARTALVLKHRLPDAPWRDTIWVDILRPHCWLLAYRFYFLRAPPA